MFKITVDNHRFGKNIPKLLPKSLKNVIPFMELKPESKIEIEKEPKIEFEEIYKTETMTMDFKKKSNNNKFKISLN